MYVLTFTGDLDPPGADGAGLLFGDGHLTGDIARGGLAGPYRPVRCGGAGAAFVFGECGRSAPVLFFGPGDLTGPW